MAYPIQSLSDGRILYSDGTKRYPASGNSLQYANSGSEKKYQASGYGTQYANDLNNKDFSKSKTSSSSSSKKSSSSSKSTYKAPNTNFVSMLNNLVFPKVQAQTYQDTATTTPAYGEGTLSGGGDKNMFGFDTAFRNYSQLLKNIMNPTEGSIPGTKDYGLSEFQIGMGSRADEGRGNILGLKTQDNTLINAKQKNGVSLDDNSMGGYKAIPNVNYTPNDQSKSPDLNKLLSDYYSKYNSITSGNGGVNENDLYMLQSDYDNSIMNNAKNGNLTEKQQAELDKKALIKSLEKQGALVDTAFDNASSTYNRLYDTGVQDIDSQVAELQTEGEKSKTKIANDYATALRRSLANKTVSDQKRGNIYSALGTAESSDFIEKQGNADRDFTQIYNETDREGQGKVADIETTLTKAQSNAVKQKEEARKIRDERIANAMLEKNKSKEEIRKGVESANIAYYNKVNELNAGVTELQNQLLLQNKGLATDLATIKATGANDENLLRTQYELDKSSSSNMPSIVESEIKSYLNNGVSSESGVARLKNIATLYPEWATLIDQAIKGQIDSTYLDNLKSGGGNQFADILSQLINR